VAFVYLLWWLLKNGQLLGGVFVYKTTSVSLTNRTEPRLDCTLTKRS
jgi:hypothetical protein